MRKCDMARRIRKKEDLIGTSNTTKYYRNIYIGIKY